MSCIICEFSVLDYDVTATISQNVFILASNTSQNDRILSIAISIIRKVGFLEQMYEYFGASVAF